MAFVPIMCAGGSSGGAPVPAAPTQSIDFNGTTQYLTISSANFGTYDRAKFSLVGSFNGAAVAGGTSQFIKARGAAATGADKSFQLYTNSGQLYFQMYNSSGLTQGQFLTSAILSNDTFYAYKVDFDFAAASDDRIKVWINGTQVTASSYTAPATAINNNSSDTSIGARENGTIPFDGLIYSEATFSGVNPDAADIFDGTSGALKGFTGLAGLHSYLSVEGGNVAADAVLAADWTNNGTATASGTIP